MEKSNDQKCAGCYHRRDLYIPFDGYYSACLYTCDTGRLRECTAKECYAKKIHYENRKRDRSDFLW